MSRQQPPATPAPAPETEPATVAACQADYAQRTGSNPGHFTAAPHTLGRK